jgi:hypothetical protein
MTLGWHRSPSYAVVAKPVCVPLLQWLTPGPARTRPIQQVAMACFESAILALACRTMKKQSNRSPSSDPQISFEWMDADPYALEKAALAFLDIVCAYDARPP